MSVLIGIVNLFIIPLVSCSIYAARMKMPKCPSFDTVMLYALFTPLLMICTRIASWIMQKTLGIDAQPDKIKYTAASLAIAVILPFVMEMIKKAVSIECTIEKKEGKGTDENV